MIIKNSSKYDTDYRRSHNIVPTPCIQQSLSLQRSYQIRANYEFDYTIEKGGVCFFVTFTFNDSSITKLDFPLSGDSCAFLNNNHFRDMMHNYLNKQILRNFNCKINYILTSEFGDGKGVRGYSENPHHHVLFYLLPLSDDSKVPTSDVFMHILRNYWCGCNYENLDARSYKYGIVSYSKDDKGIERPVVDSWKALAYVTKYIVKDGVFRGKFKMLLKYLYEVLDCVRDTPCSDPSILSEYSFVDYYNIILSDKNISNLKRVDLFSYIYQLVGHFAPYCSDFDSTKSILYRVARHLSAYMLPRVKTSRQFGASYLSTAVPSSNMKLPLNTCHGVKYFPLPLYYYRKIFNDTFIHPNDEKKSVHYINNRTWFSVFHNEHEFYDSIFASAQKLYSKLYPYTGSKYLDYKSYIDSILSPNALQLDSNVSLTDCLDYVIFTKVYRFRKNIDYVSTPYDDFVRFTISDARTDVFRVPQRDFGLISPNSELSLKVQFIDRILDFLTLYKHETLYKKNCEWRRLRRSHYSKHISNI